MAQTKDKPSPPKPPRLPSAQEVGAHLPPLGHDDEEAEQSAVDAIRSELHDAFMSLSSAVNKLDEFDAEQG
jgi:hypothetical protein